MVKGEVNIIIVVNTGEKFMKWLGKSYLEIPRQTDIVGRQGRRAAGCGF